MSRTVWAAERQAVIDRHDADVRAVGLGPVWDQLIEREDNAARGVLLGIVGALGTCLHEMGFSPPP